jgi:hypothetical protein
MSDNTRDAIAPMDGRDRVYANSFSRTSFGIASGLPNRSSEGAMSWWSQTESNRRPPACKAGALPTELWPRIGGRPSSPRLQRATFAVRRLACQPKRPISQKNWPRRLVGLGRFELPTSRLSSARSNQLSYRPQFRFKLQTRGHTLVPRCLKSAGTFDAPTTLDSVGSSEKKEKRRRRSPANRHANPETDMP